MQEPPEATMRRSRREGPKNHMVNEIQTVVASSHWSTLRAVRVCGGLETQEKKNRPVVHPHAFLVKKIFRGLDLLAK